MDINAEIEKCKCGVIFTDFKQIGMCPFCDPDDYHEKLILGDKENGNDKS